MSLLHLPLLVMALLPGSPVRTPEIEGRVVRVQAADSITIASEDAVGGRLKVRLFGVRCPDVRQRLGRQAYEFTKRASFGRTVHVTFLTDDGEVTVIGPKTVVKKPLVVNRALVEAGLARTHKDMGRYAKEEQKARAAKRGIWTSR